MALRSCVSSRVHDGLLQSIEEAVKESSSARLHALLSEGQISAEELTYKSLLHQAAWLGHTSCVRLLLDHGAYPDVPHRKNGCTPLHLAHFCTIEDTNPGLTIRTLVAAGANINNPGSRKCGKFPIDHAIQHQRFDSVQVLLSEGSQVTLQSVLIAIDVANPQILELLLINGGDCGRQLLDTVIFWGQPLHRVLYTPLKCPRECYKQMFRLLVQASVCAPLSVGGGASRGVGEEEGPGGGGGARAEGTEDAEAADSCLRVKLPTNTHLIIETELRAMAKEYVDMAQYLYAFLLRNGFVPSDSVRRTMACYGGGGPGPIDWVDEYLRNAPTLKELTVRRIRSQIYASCRNITCGIQRLHLPSRLKNHILLINPF